MTDGTLISIAPSHRIRCAFDEREQNKKNCDDDDDKKELTNYYYLTSIEQSFFSNFIVIYTLRR